MVQFELSSTQVIERIDGRRPAEASDRPHADAVQNRSRRVAGRPLDHGRHERRAAASRPTRTSDCSIAPKDSAATKRARRKPGRRAKDRFASCTPSGRIWPDGHAGRFTPPARVFASTAAILSSRAKRSSLKRSPCSARLGWTALPPTSSAAASPIGSPVQPTRSPRGDRQPHLAASLSAGLVDTPNDFGRQGSKPTHPALLDYLASELVEHGWSLKHTTARSGFSATTGKEFANPGGNEGRSAVALALAHPAAAARGRADSRQHPAGQRRASPAMGGPGVPPSSRRNITCGYHSQGALRAGRMAADDLPRPTCGASSTPCSAPSIRPTAA